MSPIRSQIKMQMQSSSNTNIQLVLVLECWRRSFHFEDTIFRGSTYSVCEAANSEKALLIYSNNTRYNLINCCLPSCLCFNGTHTVLYVCQNNFGGGIWPPALIPTSWLMRIPSLDSEPPKTLFITVLSKESVPGETPRSHDCGLPQVDHSSLLCPHWHVLGSLKI